MSSPDYPLTLDVRGRRVLVVGGGMVAARRVERLLASGARVEVVAPAPGERVAAWARSGEIAWHARPYAESDLLDPARAWLVHAATDDPAVNATVADGAAVEGIWCVRADAADRSAAWTPAVGVGRGPGAGLQVAVTAGGDPQRAAALRDAIVTAIAAGDLPSRAMRHTASAFRRGRVALVGGGPGADDLITVRGLRLLAQADVVVTDRLGPTGLLPGLPAHVEVIDVGKRPGHHPVPQHAINDLLVRHARAGAFVVRLKGGDPFVLGRGGEELLHCAARGIPVEVVPGVTSAVSVPAAAGIPVTHRGIATSFVVASGHDGPEAVLAAARDAAADATLVLLMGTARLEETVAGLIAAGRRADTPVAIIESGWTDRQRTTITTLRDAHADARAAGVQPPAVIVVGDVVGVGAQAQAAAANWLTSPVGSRA
ncbi:MAG: uroporphyrinogen-III C-methyltransferase [Dermatophilaceae bacterium]